MKRSLFVYMIALALTVGCQQSSSSRGAATTTPPATPDSQHTAPGGPAPGRADSGVRRDSLVGHDRAIQPRMGRDANGRLVPRDTME